MLALRTRRGSCPLAPTFGSRLHEIRKLSPRSDRLAESYAREAIEHLVASREVRALDVEASVRGSALLIVLSYTTRAGERPSLPYLHLVEG